MLHYTDCEKGDPPPQTQRVRVYTPSPEYWCDQVPHVTTVTTHYRFRSKIVLYTEGGPRERERDSPTRGNLASVIQHSFGLVYFSEVQLQDRLSGSIRGSTVDSGRTVVNTLLHSLSR